jgi:acyl-CoA synthetase (NDP forming)
MLAEAGVAVFRTPEACADAVAAAFSRLPPRAAASAGPFIAESRSLDEAEANGVLARIGVAHAPFVALAADEVAAAVLPFAAPFVVKILHRDIPHKSDVGGVMLGVTAQALAEAARRIVADVARHVPTAAPRILIQPMIKALGEVLIGFQIDPQAGPVVLLAAGGLLTELYRDRSVRMAPIDLATAFEMIGDVVALRALEGFRGRPRGDMQALAEALVALSRLAVDPVIVAYEVNPLMVLAEGQGVVAVDAVAWSR